LIEARSGPRGSRARYRKGRKKRKKERMKRESTESVKLGKKFPQESPCVKQKKGGERGKRGKTPRMFRPAFSMQEKKKKEGGGGKPFSSRKPEPSEKEERGKREKERKRERNQGVEMGPHCLHSGYP